MSLQDKQRQIKQRDQRIRELETAKNRLINNKIRNDRALDQAVRKAKDDGRKFVIEKLKTAIPTTAPSYFKPAAKALLSDLQRIIKDEEKRA